MPTQLGFFGTQHPLRFPARCRAEGRVLLKAVASSSPDSIWVRGIVRGGDYVSYTTATSPDGYPVKLTADGFADITAGFSTARQLYLAESYSRKLQMWTGDAEHYINNHAPVGHLLNLQLTALTPMTPVAFSSLFTDFEGDTLTILAVSGPKPAGTTTDNGVFQGTPKNIAASGVLQILVRDVARDTGTAQINWTVIIVPIDAGALTEEQRLKTKVGGALTG
jgi:hypothetical protein